MALCPNNRWGPPLPWGLLAVVCAAVGCGATVDYTPVAAKDTTAESPGDAANDTAATDPSINGTPPAEEAPFADAPIDEAPLFEFPEPEAVEAPAPSTQPEPDLTVEPPPPAPADPDDEPPPNGDAIEALFGEAPPAPSADDPPIEAPATSELNPETLFGGSLSPTEAVPPEPPPNEESAPSLPPVSTSPFPGAFDDSDPFSDLFGENNTPEDERGDDAPGEALPVETGTGLDGPGFAAPAVTDPLPPPSTTPSPTPAGPPPSQRPVPKRPTVAATPVDVNNTRHLAWLLGSKVSLASLSQLIEPGAAVGDDWQLGAVAELLGVAPPAAPARSGTIGQAISVLLAETRRLADELAGKLGPDHAALVEVAVKSNLLIVLYERDQSLAEPLRRAVESAATRAGLPDEVWRPLSDVVARGPGAVELRSAVYRLHDEVERLLRTP